MVNFNFSYRDKAYMNFDLSGLGIGHSDSDFLMEVHHIERMVSLCPANSVSTDLKVKNIYIDNILVNLREKIDQDEFYIVDLSDPRYEFYLLEDHMIKYRLFKWTSCHECNTDYLPSELEYVEFVELGVSSYSEFSVLRCPRDHLIFAILLSHSIS